MSLTDRDRDSSERNPLLRARDSRWLDNALRDAGQSGSSSYKPGAGEGSSSESRKSGPSSQGLSQNPLTIGEDVEWWSEKVNIGKTNMRFESLQEKAGIVLQEKPM